MLKMLEIWRRKKRHPFTDIYILYSDSQLKGRRNAALGIIRTGFELSFAGIPAEAATGARSEGLDKRRPRGLFFYLLVLLYNPNLLRNSYLRWNYSVPLKVLLMGDFFCKAG